MHLNAERSDRTDRTEVRARDALDAFLLRSLRPLCAALAFLYLALAASKRFFVEDPRLALTLAGADIVVAVGLAGLWRWLAGSGRSPSSAHPLASLVVALALFDTALHMVLRREPLEALSFGLIAVGIGFFFTDVRWFLGASAATVATVLASVTTALPTANMPDVVALVVEAMFVASAIFFFRIRMLRRLTFAANATARRERFRVARTRILDALSSDAGSTAVLTRVARAVGEGLNWPFCDIWRVDDGGAQSLECVAWWQDGSLDDAAVRDMTSLRAAPGAGLMGRAWMDRATFWVDDMSAVPVLTRSDVAKRAGLHAACAVPIMADRRVLGVVEAFSREAGPQDPDVIDLLVSIAADIGSHLAREEADRSMRESERRYRELAGILQAQSDASTAGILVVDPSGAVVSFNRQFTRMWGFPPSVAESSDEQLLARATEQVADPSAFIARIVALYEHPDETAWDEVKLLDGRIFDRYTAPVRSPDGAYLGRVWFFHDATARHQADADIARLNAELQHRIAALAAANRELETFSYTVSHDLRAPLRAIRTFSEDLRVDHREALDEEGRDLVERIRTSAMRMEDLVADILALGRMSGGDLVRTEVDVTALATEIIERLRQSEPPRRVDVTVAPGLRVRADERLVRVALENLLANAWKFTRGVVVAQVTVDGHREDGASVICVRDNGAGFDPARADRLFQPFRRLHTAAEFEGTGIGLATVHRIVDRHGGRVWAEGKIGEGATFCMSFPDGPAPDQRGT